LNAASIMPPLVTPWLSGVAVGALFTMVVYLETSTVTGLSPAQVHQDYEIEREAKRGGIPNYEKRDWWARNLFWVDAQYRGSGLAVFGMDAIRCVNADDRIGMMGASECTLQPWAKLCSQDSDHDGYTNGMELGE